MKIVVGSTNPAKIKAAQIVINKLFPEHKVKLKGVEVESGVDSQPKSDQEAMDGAINRAKAALQKTNADFAIGMEGGIHKIGKHWFECGWIAVVDKNGNLGLGSSGRWKVSKKIANELLAGRELAEVIEILTGDTGANLREGIMGKITNGHLPRDLAYSHGIIFAFAPFISDSRYWD